MSDPSEAAIRALLQEYDDAVRNEIRYQDWGMVDGRVDAASRAAFALDQAALPVLDRIAGEGSGLSDHARFVAEHIRRRKPPPPPRGADALARRFHDKAIWWPNRAEALDRLRAANDDEAIEILLALVGDDADRLADSMSAMGSHAEGALARGVRAVIERRRGLVARLLDKLGDHAEEAAVRRMLASRGRVRGEAVRAVAELASASSLASALESEWHEFAEDARRQIVIALGDVKPMEMRCEALARWIDDPAPAVRVEAIARMKGAAVLGADLARRLVEIVRSDPEFGARAAAADVLGGMRPSAPEATAVIEGLRAIVLERPAARRDAMRAIAAVRRERTGEEPSTRFVPWDAEKFERAVAALAPAAAPGSVRDVEDVVVVAQAYTEDAGAKARALVRAITHTRGEELALYLVEQLLGAPALAAIAEALGRGEGYRGVAVDPLRDRLVVALSGLPRSRIAHLASHENALIRDLAARAG